MKNQTINWTDAAEAIANGDRVRRSDWPAQWHIGAKGDGSGDFQWHDGATFRHSDDDAAHAYEVVSGGVK